MQKKKKSRWTYQKNKGKDQMTQKADDTTSKNASKCFSTKYFILELKISKFMLMILNVQYEF